MRPLESPRLRSRCVMLWLKSRFSAIKNSVNVATAAGVVLYGVLRYGNWLDDETLGPVLRPLPAATRPDGIRNLGLEHRRLVEPNAGDESPPSYQNEPVVGLDIGAQSSAIDEQLCLLVADSTTLRVASLPRTCIPNVVGLSE